jgi:hypothetical protein
VDRAGAGTSRNAGSTAASSRFWAAQKASKSAGSVCTGRSSSGLKAAVAAASTSLPSMPALTLQRTNPGASPPGAASNKPSSGTTALRSGPSSMSGPRR